MKHGLILGEPYRLDGEIYVAGYFCEPGCIVLFDFAEGDPETLGDMYYHIDDDGRIWSIDQDPERAVFASGDLWRDVGVVLIPTDWTVADLVAEGLDPEVWGNL